MAKKLKILSISLGSSKRDKKVEVNIGSAVVEIERRGTDGSLEKAKQLFTEYDGKVDAFGMGGVDLYLRSGDKRYLIKDVHKLIKDVKTTPTLDGSGLKRTLEPKVISDLQKGGIVDFNGKNVLMVCAADDRFEMAKVLKSLGAKITYGDLIFSLGLPIAIKSEKAFKRLTSILLPIAVRLPFKWLYPTGKEQESQNQQKHSKYEKYYHENDIIVGDYHYIKKYLPNSLEGKTIITNTITEDDLKALEERKVKLLVTTTPNLNGRSFGTNVMEAFIVAMAGKKSLSDAEYLEQIEKLNLKPFIKKFF